MSFLPKDYEKPAGNSKYFKFQTGDNKFRILSHAVIGYLDWDDKQPIRTKDRPERSIDPAKPVKHFWAFIVWDYQEKVLKILELTQATIQDAIFNLDSDEAWGNPTGYDLNVKKEGEKMATKYTTMPVPPKPLHPEIKRLYEEAFIDLEALFVGGDPFAASKTSAPVQEEDEPAENEIKVEDIPF